MKALKDQLREWKTIKTSKEEKQEKTKRKVKYS